MRWMLLLVALALSAGCGKPEPIRAGGKPVQHWVEALKSPDVALRKKAAFKLGNVGTADGSAIPALVGALRDRDAGVRREAVLALLKCGVAAKEALPALAEMEARDPDRRVRECAAKAVEKLQAR